MTENNCLTSVDIPRIPNAVLAVQRFERSNPSRVTRNIFFVPWSFYMQAFAAKACHQKCYPKEQNAVESISLKA